MFIRSDQESFRLGLLLPVLNKLVIKNGSHRDKVIFVIRSEKEFLIGKIVYLRVFVAIKEVTFIVHRLLLLFVEVLHLNILGLNKRL
jgi:hypothetical protein